MTIHPSDSLHFISRAPYTVPADKMAPLAALLLRRHSTNVQALADALAELAGPARAVTLAGALLKATQNNARKS